MGAAEERLLAVAARVSDALSEDASAISGWDTEEVEATPDGTVDALREIARVAGAYRALVRSDTDRVARTSAPLGRWGHLVLKEKLGEGAAAEVYRALDTRLDHDVALKLFKRTGLSPSEKRTVLEEGRRHARVKHPNIATIHDADEHDGRVGISMEYIDGLTLHDLVAHQGPLGAAEAAHIAVELCRAVAAIHGKGLVHGDIKAQNVMREKGGRIVLMDFSTSRPVEPEPLEDRTHTQGTPIYMAPELFAGVAPSPGSDIYALGVLLFYLATGEYPVRARTLSALHEALERGERQSLYELRPDLPNGFVQTVERASAPDPHQRFQSVGPLVGALTQISQPLPATDGLGTQEAEGLRRRAPLPAFVRPIAAGAAILALITFLGFVSSTALNVTLGRSADFAPESVARWFVWGLRALIAPVVYMAMAALPVVLVVGAWRLASLLGPVRRAGARVRAPVDRAIERLHLDDPTILAQILFAVGFVAVAGICWGFSDLIHAFMTPLDRAYGGELGALEPERVDEHMAYGQALDLVILAVSFGWYKVYRAWRRRERPRGAVMPLAATLGVILAAVLLWATPYQILWQNEFHMVDIEGQRGYMLGEREGDLLIYLPDAPRNERRLVIHEDDPRLRRLEVVESVFSP